MKIVLLIVLLVACAYVSYKCQSSLFGTYSQKYDEEHDAVLVQKIADEVIKRLDEREGKS